MNRCMRPPLRPPRRAWHLRPPRPLPRPTLGQPHPQPRPPRAPATPRLRRLAWPLSSAPPISRSPPLRPCRPRRRSGSWSRSTSPRSSSRSQRCVGFRAFCVCVSLVVSFALDVVSHGGHCVTAFLCLRAFARFRQMQIKETIKRSGRSFIPASKARMLTRSFSSTPFCAEE